MQIAHRLAVATATVATVLGALVGVPAAGAADPSVERAAERARPGGSFEVASFNILGSQHTVHDPRWRSGKVRARMAKRWLEAEGTSVVGLQEAQVDQMRALTRSKRWRAYPDPRRSVNTQTAQSVAWRTSKWAFVQARTFDVPFDITQVRQQPMVLLRHRGTGRQVWVVSVHFTSGGGPHATAERRIGTRRLISQVRRLEATGVPVVVTGDMNDHAPFFCRFAGATGFVNPGGGSSYDGTCAPPPSMRIDWIMGTRQLSWSGFRYAEDPLLSQVTDHSVPVARATFG